MTREKERGNDKRGRRRKRMTRGEGGRGKEERGEGGRKKKAQNE